jgi:hypothetical protein
MRAATGIRARHAGEKGREERIMTGHWQLRTREVVGLVFFSIVLGFSISALLPPYPTGGLEVSSFAFLGFAQICLIAYVLRSARRRS